MQQKNNNLRTVVYTIVAITLCTVLMVFVINSVPGINETCLLNFTAIIISVATLSSINFAVVNYIESTVLSKRVKEAKNTAQKQHAQALSDLQSIRNIYCEVARISFKGILETFMSMQPGPNYEKAIKNLVIAEININLAHGTQDSLLRAIEATYKYDKRRFLDMESQIWDKAKYMQKEESQKVKEYYLVLKKRVLDLLTTADRQSR